MLSNKLLHAAYTEPEKLCHAPHQLENCTHSYVTVYVKQIKSLHSLRWNLQYCNYNRSDIVLKAATIGPHAFVRGFSNVLIPDWLVASDSAVILNVMIINSNGTKSGKIKKKTWFVSLVLKKRWKNKLAGRAWNFNKIKMDTKILATSYKKPKWQTLYA